MIKLSVGQLEKETVQLQGSEPAEFLDMPENGQFTIVTPMSYDLTARYVSGEALVTGKCRVGVSGTCGRCLENADKTIETDDLCLLFELDDVRDELDISEDIRAEMLLALPMNFLCKDDCAGLCPVCGVDRNHKKCRCADTPKGNLAWSALDDLEL